MNHLIIDCDFLCHRIFHSSNWTAGFAHLDSVFLRDVELLVNQFAPDCLSLCFDSRSSKRRRAYPGYKNVRRKARKRLSQEEKDNWEQFCKERARLRATLRKMGFQNVFLEKGYESDDLIAALVDSDMANSSMLQVTIVTSDHDMFQLLSSRTSLYLLGKRKMYTLQDFQAEWGISPSQWVDVKSIAGCSSDNIIGIDGVGEISAAKYMRGQLKSSSRVYRKIVEKAHTWRRNYDLVRLPYVGCPKIQAVPEKSWTFKTRLKGVRNRGKAKRK